MRILHYSLGLPPYRSGGLTKYSTDLMLTQKSRHTVSLLWPGQMDFFCNTPYIRKMQSFQGVDVFELHNPLPVPLDEGVSGKKIKAFSAPCDKKVYLQFLKMLNPDVIHVHTLMGLHREFFIAANELNIRIVFTSHDYYGLCSRVTFFKNGGICTNDCSCKECVICNETALSLTKIRVLQSHIYQNLKNSIIIKFIRKQHRNKFLSENVAKGRATQQLDKEKILLLAQEYEKLRAYYVSILEKITIIHYNSRVSQYVYQHYINNTSNKVIPITHRDIKDHRRVKSYSHKKVKMTYLGPARASKGIYYLLRILDSLWQDNQRNFDLQLYCLISEKRPYISYQKDGYSYSDMEDIFNKTDVLIVPSQWYETFGFTVLEALSYGVPVLVSNKVGAQDLLLNIGKGYKTILNKELRENIYSVVQNIDILKALNKEIVEVDAGKIFPRIEDVEKLYRGGE